MNAAKNATDGHAALMDKIYRHQRHIYDFTRKYYLFGRDRMIREMALAPGQTVLEVGCGTARNLIRIARLYPDTKLFGLDASAEMLHTASRNVERAGLAKRIHLEEAYAENLTPALFGQEKPFDRILFSYSLSMIPDWKQALRAAGEALADDGSLHVVDFGDLGGLGVFAAGLLKAWLRLFHVEPRVEVLQMLESDCQDRGGRSRQISMLPARYAFLWTGNKAAMKDFGSFHVASRTQPARKSTDLSLKRAIPVDIPPRHPQQ